MEIVDRNQGDGFNGPNSTCIFQCRPIYEVRKGLDSYAYKRGRSYMLGMAPKIFEILLFSI